MNEQTRPPIISQFQEQAAREDARLDDSAAFDDVMARRVYVIRSVGVVQHVKPSAMDVVQTAIWGTQKGFAKTEDALDRALSIVARDVTRFSELLAIRGYIWDHAPTHNKDPYLALLDQVTDLSLDHLSRKPDSQEAQNLLKQLSEKGGTEEQMGVVRRQALGPVRRLFSSLARVPQPSMRP